METMQMEKVKKLVPELRFKGFEGEFEYKKLGDVSNVIMGQSPDSKSYNENGEGYYLIQGNADIKNRISSPRQWTNMPTKTCEIGDVILTVRAPVGAVAKSLHNACIGRGVCVIRNLEKYDLEYIYQFLLDFETKWGKLEQGSTFTAVSGAEIKSIKIVLPTLPEQQKIASFLSAVDEKIQQLTRKKELMEQYKKGVMQQLFSGKLRFKDENGDKYADWEVKLLDDVATIKRGASPRPIADPKWFDSDSNIGWVRISDVTKSNKYLEKTTQYLTAEGVNKSRLVKTGSMIMSICATIGKPIYTKFEVCIHDGFVVFENLQADKEFLYYYLDKIQLHWYKYGQPGSQVNLNSTIVANETMPYPCLAEQQKIANFLSSIDNKIESTSQQITKTQTFKKGLLQKMFV